MKNFTVTGLTLKEYLKFQKHNKARCYICRRRDDEESVVFDEDKGKYFIENVGLGEYEISFGDDEGTAKFLLCPDCYILLSNISRTEDFSQIIKNQMNKN